MALGTQQKVIFITTTGASTFYVPSDFGQFISVEAIGGGGGSGSDAGGGGGAYSKSTSVKGLYKNIPVFVSVGAGGSTSVAGDTWFNVVSNAAPTLTSQGVLAKAGGQGTGTGPIAGGAAASGVGDIKYSGGSSGTNNGVQGRSGGGGAAGPGGNGGNGGDCTGTGYSGGGGGASLTSAGGNAPTAASVNGNGGNGGVGSGGGVAPGGAGTPGTGGGGAGYNSGIAGAGAYGTTIWTDYSGVTAGSGGGGGGASNASSGGAGGLYGGGAGAKATSGNTGGQGIIIFTYYPDIQSGFKKEDSVFGTIDLDDQYVTDQWLVDKYVGGTLFGWGNNSAGQIGNGNTAYYSSPVQIGSLTSWKQVSSSRGGATATVLAVKTDGTLWGWGYNSTGSGALGVNNLTNYSSPIQVGALTNWKQVSVGGVGGANLNLAAAAIKTDGTLWTWGTNSYGQLGNGNRTYYSSPVQVGALTNWKEVVVGGNVTTTYMLAIKQDGTLWAWGSNNLGQLGDGSTTYRSSPVQVGALTNWKSLATMNSGDTSYAIKTDGSLWAWGNNVRGQLGNSYALNYYSSPVQVGTLYNWKQVAVATTNATASATSLPTTVAVKTDGTLWTWGTNIQGQLGLGFTSASQYYSSPIQVGALTNWKQATWTGITAGCIAIKTDGTLWAWGSNTNGDLGLGNQTNYSSPVQVGSLTNWKQVSGGLALTFTDLN